MGLETAEYHICRICGDRASGFHYGVFCCEGCKGFFFRTVRGNKRYKVCNKTGRCLVLKSSRNCCRFCRMQRCLEMGMSYESVKMGRYRKADNGTRKTMLTRVKSPDELMLSIYKGYVRACQTCKNMCEMSENDYIRIDESSTENTLYNIFVPDIVCFATTFAKDINMFQKMTPGLQRVLIKSSILELSLLQDALNIDITEYEIINHRLGYTVNKSVSENTGRLGTILLQSEIIGRKLAVINLTPVELSLLMALSLFASGRMGVGAAADLEIQNIEELLLTTLKYQVVMNHNSHTDILPNIIEVMCVLRGLTSLYLTDLLESDYESL